MTKVPLSLIFLLSLLTAAANDLQTLLSVRSSINDPLNSLSSWLTSTPLHQWRGVTCLPNSTLPHVTRILLPNLNLSGFLPTPLLSLPSLHTLDLSSNSLLGNLTSPVTPSLRHLNLSNNNLSGTITFQSHGWDGLVTLDLSNNYFTGGIPERLVRFNYLKALELGGNCLQGPIPPSIFEGMRSIERLTLASNQLTGPIPPEIGLIPTVQWLYLGYNNLSGEIPPQTGNLTALEHLDLVYNNVRGRIPESVGNLQNLRYLFLYMNELSGEIPPSIYNLTALVSLDLSFNQLSGGISDAIEQLGNLETLHLFVNRFSGEIPPSISYLSNLRVLQLWSNNFSGKIPINLGRRSNLTIVDLSTNNLTGVIPEHLCRFGGLKKLILFSNHLHGRIPQRFGKCNSLARARLQNNKLSGRIPVEFSKLPLVYYLDLSSNKLTGRIDDRVWEMGSLQMVSLSHNQFEGALVGSFGSKKKLQVMDLSGNRFSGKIPSELGNLVELERLNLSANRLEGRIPSTISGCQKLVVLDASNNQLSDEIPEALCDLAVLGELDLSENMLSGEVPACLGRSGSLLHVNISLNDLHGRLPDTPAFMAINLSAVSGNSGLCSDKDNGNNGLPTCGSPRWHWRYAVPALSALAILLSVLALYLSMIRRRNRNGHVIRVCGNGSWEVRLFDRRDRWSVKSDESALSSLKDGEIVSDGRGSATWLVVRELLVDESVMGWREVNVLGRLRQSNVMRLVRACKSHGRWLLMYEAVEGRRLGEDGVLEGLGWTRRLVVAEGVIHGLMALNRSRLSTRFWTGSLMDEVMLVGVEEQPRLWVTMPKIIDAEDIVSTEMRDVLSFGVLLIQLLTGRRTSSAPNELGRIEELIEWARHGYSELLVEKWIDPALRGRVGSIEHAQITKTMELALRCTQDVPGDRPRISEVGRQLRALKEKKGLLVAMQG